MASTFWRGNFEPRVKEKKIFKDFSTPKSVFDCKIQAYVGYFYKLSPWYIPTLKHRFQNDSDSNRKPKLLIFRFSTLIEIDNRSTLVEIESLFIFIEVKILSAMLPETVMSGFLRMLELNIPRINWSEIWFW